jgi:tetraacyldisaccharide 4'-kinase
MKLFLLPFAWVYDLLTRIRNKLFTIGLKNTKSFQHICTISVGNLNMGGSGKTPLTEYLIRLLFKKHRITTLSRGYGRLTKGMRLSNAADNANTIGDEPLQLFKKFGHQIDVVVSENRIIAIEEILKQKDHSEVIILDDAFQQRSIRPDLNIMLTRFSDPFFDDLIFPAGWLRESRYGAKRADIIVVTKCPEKISAEEMGYYKRRIRKFSGDKPVFFTQIDYSAPVAFGNQNTIGEKIILLTGIAQSGILLKHCKTQFQVLEHLRYADHHPYSIQDVQNIITRARKLNASILTTEKDMIRLLKYESQELIKNNAWFYWPIEFKFYTNQEEFDSLIIKSIQLKLAARR